MLSTLERLNGDARSLPVAADDPGLRILLVIEAAGGGVGRHVADLAGGLVARGHDVHLVYAPDRAEPRFMDEITSVRGLTAAALPMRRAIGPADLAACLRLRNYIRRHGPFDVIHGHSSKAGALARLAGVGVKARKVYTAHAFRTMDPVLGGKGRLVFGAIETALARALTDTVICVSPEELTHARALGIPAAKLRQVVNAAAPFPALDRAALRARLGLDASSVAIGSVGRFAPQKAPERLIDAAASLRARNIDARVLLFGHGELEAGLARRIAADGLADRVRLVGGWTGQEALTALDVLAMPSRYEAMPYVLIEALAAGRPIVTTAVGGASATVADGVNGFIVPPGDDGCAAFTDALERLAADPDLREAMGAASLRRSALFSIDRMLDHTLRCYRAGAAAETPEDEAELAVFAE